MASVASGGLAAFVLDVRNTAEYEEGHLATSVNIPLDELRFRLEEVPHNVKIHVHCLSGFRSHLALRILKENGYENVVNVTGSYKAILAEGGFDIVR